MHDYVNHFTDAWGDLGDKYSLQIEKPYYHIKYTFFFKVFKLQS